MTTALTTSGAHRLHVAATAFTAAVLVHNADHLRRGPGSTSSSVLVLGSLAILLEVAVVVIVFTDHPWAPLVAAVVGADLALGYLLVHFTPSHGFASDSFITGEAAVVSILAATFETAASAFLAVEGLRAMRPGGVRAVPPDAPSREQLARACRQPVPAIMLAGNVLVLAATILR
jgi:hypothetical protein